MRSPVEWLSRGSGPRRTGIALCTAGVALLWAPSLLAAALGLELVAAAIWWWGRAAEDAPQQVTRWSWMRRPATALWLAFAIHAAFPMLAQAHHSVFSARGALLELARGAGTLDLFRTIAAAAVVWAGLELLAALPLTRAFSDLPGPFLGVRIWLPALLPAAGFAVLWRHDEWTQVAAVRQTAIVLLMITAVLAALRAYARRAWTASLRWLVVTDCALAALLVAGGAVTPTATLLLWLAACGAHVFLLAGELRGSAPRRGAQITRLWRAASGVALASLAWPTAIANGPGHLGRLSGVVWPGIAFTSGLAEWITVGRMVHAEERRKVMRADPALTLTHVAALLVLVLGPFALLVAWWGGFEPHWRESLAGLLPAVVGAWAGIAARQSRPRGVWGRLEGVGVASRGLARRVFALVVYIERRVLAALDGLTGWIAGAMHDLHTGDAQEYLMFLVGLAVLAVVLPLLR